MKKFLLEILKYFILVSFLFSLIFTAVYFIISTASFDIPKDRNILIVGDSHTACSIDDAIFTHSVNMSQGGTAYLYSYIKVRKFINENPHIDTVLVSFHGTGITKGMDEFTTGERYILKDIPWHISLLKTDELPVFIFKPSFYSALAKVPLKHIRAVFRYIVGYSLTYNDLYIGGYERTDRERLEKAIEREESNEYKESGFSEYQLKFLLKIIELCKEKNVRIILISTPIYNVERYGYLPELNSFYNTYLSGVQFLDFSTFAMPDYGYGDIDHLNYKGAEIFSRYLENNYDTIFK